MTADDPTQEPNDLVQSGLEEIWPTEGKQVFYLNSTTATEEEAGTEVHLINAEAHSTVRSAETEGPVPVTHASVAPVTVYELTPESPDMWTMTTYQVPGKQKVSLRTLTNDKPETSNVDTSGRMTLVKSQLDDTLMEKHELNRDTVLVYQPEYAVVKDPIGGFSADGTPNEYNEDDLVQDAWLCNTNITSEDATSISGTGILVVHAKFPG